MIDPLQRSSIMPIKYVEMKTPSYTHSQLDERKAKNSITVQLLPDFLYEVIFPNSKVKHAEIGRYLIKHPIFKEK